MSQSTARAKSKKHLVTPKGQIHIQSTFNNIIITITNLSGQTIAWSSAGKKGFRGAKKNTPYAAQQAAEDCAKTAFDLGLRQAVAYTKGAGTGKESALRAIHNTGIQITKITDITPVPHNGCRPPKQRKP